MSSTIKKQWYLIIENPKLIKDPRRIAFLFGHINKYGILISSEGFTILDVKNEHRVISGDYLHLSNKWSKRIPLGT